MTLYEILKTYILAPLFDLTLYDGFGEWIFYHVLAVALACIVVHLFVIVPYRVVLKLCGYKRFTR